MARGQALVGLITGTSGMRVEEVSGDLIHWVHTNSHLTDLRTGATYRLTGDSSYTGVALRGGAYGDTYDYKSVVVPVAELPPLSRNC